MYSFRKYSKELKDDWFYIANQEITSSINAHEELVLDKNKEYNITIYKIDEGDEIKKVPIAIFVSNGISVKVKGLIKELDANFGGLYIQRSLSREVVAIKYFFYEKVVLDYFSKICHIDLIQFMYPALASIENPESSFISNPSPYSNVNNNSIL